MAPVDAVLSTATFHWVTDHDQLFANLHDVLRPGGQLVAQCGGQGNIASVIEAVKSLGVERAGTWLYASPEETAERLRRAGFVDVQTWAHPEPVPFPDRAGAGAVPGDGVPPRAPGHFARGRTAAIRRGGGGGDARARDRLRAAQHRGAGRDA